MQDERRATRLVADVLAPGVYYPPPMIFVGCDGCDG
jgi:hypothetical protein